jgi:hypothetical protein
MFSKSAAEKCPMWSVFFETADQKGLLWHVKRDWDANGEIFLRLHYESFS